MRAHAQSSVAHPLRRHDDRPAPALSVVAPCYNEQEGLAAFVERMTAACAAVAGDDYELLLVNDGSRDATWAVIQAMAAKYQAGLAQIVFRFSQQIGMVPLTGTTNPHHMKEDLQSDRFKLVPEEVRQIETIGL